MNDELATWLRRQIEHRLGLARHTIELENSAEWHEISSGVLVTGPPEADDTWQGTWAMGDSSLTRLMEANDPRDTIARCEAELAILNVHFAIQGTSPQHPYCRECNGPPMLASWPCRTVRHLTAAYKHRPGYREEWAP